MFRIEIIETGYIKVDGGAMFGAIPKRAWKRKYACDEDNLCSLTMRCVLLISDRYKILIDLGMGNKHLQDVKYYQPSDLKNIEIEINKYGIKAEDITDVILTHLHFDHCGYATKENKDRQTVPSFPRANYWLSKDQWDSMLCPTLLEKDSFFKNNILPIKEAGLLRLIDCDTQCHKGLSLKLFDGHTRGQIVAYIDTGNETVAFPGDLIPTAAHVALEWISAYDINAEKTLFEKKIFLEDACKHDYTLVYCHDAEIWKSKVKRLNQNYIAADCVKVAK